MREKALPENQYEILVAPQGDRIWVNGPDGSSIARFSKRFGIDVHNTATAQMRGAPECLMCTHSPAGAAEWQKFCAAVKEFHGVEVDPQALKFDQ